MVTYATYLAILKVLTYFPKPIKNCIDVLFQLCQKFAFFRRKDKRTKNVLLFRYFRTHTKPQTTPKKLNKKTRVVTKQDLVVVHLIICSLSSNINELKLLLSGLNLNFDIIYISESRITKSNLPTNNVHITGYNIEQTSTESLAGGSLIYISQKFSYKSRHDL